MAAKQLEDRLIDRMHELEEQYREVLEARARNRSNLRNLMLDGMLTEEQSATVEEIYPTRAARGSGGEDES